MTVHAARKPLYSNNLARRRRLTMKIASSPFAIFVSIGLAPNGIKPVPDRVLSHLSDE